MCKMMVISIDVYIVVTRAAESVKEFFRQYYWLNNTSTPEMMHA